MNVHFSNPNWLFLLLVAVPWVVWFTWKTDVPLSAWRRWTALALRLLLVLTLILALAGLQWMRPQEGMNVFFVLDRSDSIPPAQLDFSRHYVVESARKKENQDKAGVLVFGSEAGIEFSPNPVVELDKILAVVDSQRTDIAGALRLATAAFPETGQRRIVLLSDGNENMGDAMGALLAAVPLGVSLDVLPLGLTRSGDVSVQKLATPAKAKKGQTFEVKIFAQSDKVQPGLVKLFRNDQLLGQQTVDLQPGKNLFTFPQTLEEPGFYKYDVQLEVSGDALPQNNRGSSFVDIRGNPRILVVSAQVQQDQPLAAALRSAQLEVKLVDLSGLPSNLSEMQSYDAIFLSNIAAGDFPGGDEGMKLLESAVRDFGVGLVCIGGEQTYAAGGYRGTPLESTLPVEMELNSKKVLPSGALAIVAHATEFPNGNQWARDIAFAALDALGPQDEMGIVLWDGTDKWLFPMTKVGDKKGLGKQIAGMMPGDMPSFRRSMEIAHEGLKKSGSNLKHMVVFSDGDPSYPTPETMAAIVKDKITISTVMIGGHVAPEGMITMANQGGGRFYDVASPASLPQIFIKEAAVILKSAIFEEPFQPQVAASSEVIRGIGAAEYPRLRGYVCTTPKPRAEIPLVSDKGDPVLAHWQYGLGRAVAFTSDARAKWAADWITWDKYRQFWTQVAQWSLRRVENAEFKAEVAVDKGEGQIAVEALDRDGKFRNFLSLQAVVVSPKGEKQTVLLEQNGPGHYEAKFPTPHVGSYMLNLMEMRDGKLQGSQVLGASVNYSPEFSAGEPNYPLLRHLAESGGGKLLDPQVDNPFLHDRRKTFHPIDWWEWLLKLAIVLFPLDVAVRRVQIDREEWLRSTRHLRRLLFFWRGEPRRREAEESLASLLTRREEVRARQPAPVVTPNPDLFRPEKPVELGKTAAPPPASTVVASEEGPAPAKTPPASDSTTSRLLEAKNRAKKRL